MKCYEGNKTKIVEEGFTDGYKWYIKTIKGCHPCAYVEVGPDNKFYGVDLENSLENIVHGGITFSEPSGDNWVFGWDYAHSGDYSTLSFPLMSLSLFGMNDWGESSGKKYSIDEIMKDILSFIVFIKSEK